MFTSRISSNVPVALLALVGLLTIALGSARAHDPASDQADFEWSGKIAAGRTLEIHGVNGSISAVPAEGDVASVQVFKSARRSDPESVPIKVIKHDGGVTFCAVYPTPRGEKPNQCLPGGGGHMQVRNNDVEARFVVQVPAGVDFAARTVNGAVSATDLDGAVKASSVNGRIEISTAGLARASTVNGAIRARIGSSDWQGATEFHTVNGRVSVDLPHDAAFTVNAKTVHGRISSDFPISIHKKGWVGRSAHGHVGEGGGRLSLKTVNGAIRLRRADHI